jgi:hypothetical protein
MTTKSEAALPAAVSELTDSELDGVVGGFLWVLIKAVAGTVTNVVGGLKDAGVFDAIQFPHS